MEAEELGMLRHVNDIRWTWGVGHILGSAGPGLVNHPSLSAPQLVYRLQTL